MATYTYQNYAETKEERRAFYPFYPDMRDILGDDDAYAAAVQEANGDYEATFKAREA